MMDVLPLRQLNDPQKERLYSEFWGGRLPGTVLVNASQRSPDPPTLALSDGECVDDPFQRHLRFEYERLMGRDWACDDAVASPTVPIGPNGTIATAFGATYDPALDWTNQCLKRPEEICDLQPPRVGEGLTGWYLEGVRYVAEAIGDALPICYAQCLQGPFSTCSMILDDQVLLEAMYTHPDEIHRLLGLVTDFIIDFGREAARLVPRPVPTSFPDVYFPESHGICLCDDLAAVVSPWLYREFVLPHMNRLSDAFGGVFLHACGNPSAVYPIWGEIRGFRGCDIGATEANVAEAFRCFSGSAVIVCHVGLNTAPHFPSRMAVVEHILQYANPDSSVLINASTYIGNLPNVTPDEWDAESAQIVARVRNHSRQ